VFHPAYGYFADAYGLIQVAIEAQGGAPGPKHLAELIDHAKAQRSTTIFVQPQISATYAETVAKAIGARVVPLDPLALNYTENLLEMARKLAEAYEGNGSRRGGAH
jgi:zinc transport system substrate-binding protein